MKVYVDEQPKSCQKCPFCEYFEEDAHGKGKHEVACYFNGSLGNILYGNQTNPKTCPLETLADHNKQVRKEVCEEIRKKVLEYFNVKNEEEYENSLSLLDALFTADVVFEILDLIQADYVEKVEE